MPGIMDNTVNSDPNANISNKEMKTLVLDNFKAAKDKRKSREPQWIRWNELYRSHVQRTEWPFETNLFIPLTWSTVESFLPRLVSERPRLQVESRNDEDIDTARVHRELINFQWDSLAMGVKLIEFVKASLVYGTSFLKVGWEKRTANRPVPRVTIDQFEREIRTNIPQETVVYDDPVIDVVDINDIYVDPQGICLDTARYVIHRIKKDLATIEAEAKEKGYIPESVAKLKKIVKTRIDSELENVKRQRDTTFSGSSEQYPDLDHYKQFDILEYWEDDRMAIVVHDPEVILYQGSNPYWHRRKPFIRLVDNMLPWEFYGVGEPELLESLNIELNETHNIRLEQAKRNIFNMWVARRGSGINAKNVKWKPDSILWAQDIDRDIKQLLQRDLPISGYREEEVLRRHAEEASGASENFKGLDQGGAETATQASILAQASASRAGLKFQQLVEMALRPLGEMLIALNEQFITEERSITIVGPEATLRQKIDPADLVRGGATLDVRIDVGATDPVSRELRLQRTMNLLSAVGNVLGDPNHPAVQALIKRLFDLAEVPIPDPSLLEQPAIQQGAGSTPATGSQVSVGQEIGQQLSTVENQQPSPSNTADGGE